MLRPVQPYVEYVLNQDYIAEFLCINTDKPELQCNGKCHLAKQIEKQQESETNALRVSLENYPIGFVSIYKIQPLKVFVSSDESITNTAYQNLYHFEYNYSAFQPPDFV